MYVIENAKLPGASLPGIEHATLACADDGLSHLSLWRQTIQPGGATPPHRHDCEEVVLVQSGSGKLHIGGEVLGFGPDSTLTLPAGVPHQIVNSGSEPLTLVAAFSATPVRAFFPDGRPIELPWKS